MRTALPILLMLLAAAAGLWILLGSEEPGGAIDMVDTGDASPHDAEDLLEAGGLKGSGDAPKKSKRPRPRSIDPRNVARGQLDVLPVGPDLAPIPNTNLRVYVEPLGLRDWRKGLGTYDDETGTWSFNKVLAGEVEVRVFGDHVIETKQKAKVRKGQRTRVQVPVDLAGAVQWHAQLRDGTEPKDVTITLLDMDDKPVLAFHESRSARRITTPAKRTSSVQGPQGAVFGIPAGRYKLRVESEEHGYQDVVVDVELSKTAKATVELGR